jgi:hypothetical protein
MKTLVLHAGMMKTGTTSIQVSMASVPQGADYHYLYHHSNNSSTPMRLAFCNDPPAALRHDVFGAPDYREAFRKHLAEGLRQDSPTFVISAEMISASFGREDHVAMRDWFSRHVPRTRIVVYVREPGSFIESLYQQTLKEFGNGKVRPLALYPRYRQKFEAMEEVFGRENVVYRTFDPARFVGGDIVLDFASVAGFTFNKTAIVRANDSLTLPAATLLHTYHRHLPEGHQLRLNVNPGKRRMIRLLGLVRGPKLRLDRTLVVPVLRRQVEDTAWIASRVDQPLPPYRPAGDGEGICGDEDLTRSDEASLDWLGQLSGRRLRADDGPAVAGALADVSQEDGFQIRLAATRRHFAAV